MTQYWKAVHSNGTDFWSGTINYAAALGGDPITLPETPNPTCCTSAVLHASDVSTEALSSGSWPCRLFLVEGEPVAEERHNRGFFSLTVVDEVDARLALGPNADAVIGLVERASQITEAEAEKLAAVWDAIVPAAEAARAASWAAASRYAALDASRRAALEASGAADWSAVGSASWAAAEAVVVRDLISDETYEALAGPWESVMGPIFKGVAA